MAHANLIDSLLNESKVASQGHFDLDDALEPASGLRMARTASSHRAAAYATGEDSLAEAALAHTLRAEKTAKTASGRPTIEVALRFARDLKAHTRTASAAARQKVASAATQIKEATARLERLSNKTAAQMRQDGATKLADYLNPSLVPMWAKQANADLHLLTQVYHLLNPQKRAKAASSEEVLSERRMSDEEVGSYIKKLLNDGVTPKDVEQKLTKLAELEIFNRGFATDKLRADAGVVGYVFMEPNAYMDDCASSYQRMNVKLSGVRAKSVRQIQACAGCTHFKKAGSEKRCTLYQLPVVASEKELLPIINQLTKGAKNKKAALVAQANRETERPVVGIKQATRHEDNTVQRNREKVSVRTASTRTPVKVAATFTPADALGLHKAGKSLEAIYTHAVAKVGSQQANDTVRRFVAGLKGTNTKVALTQIDCTLLKRKLATSNGIIGAAKCASCTYRKGMSCGLTGGTLLSFPGMETVKTNHRVAAGAPKDGLGMMKEFEMVERMTPGDIEISKPDFADIELSGFSKVDL